MRQVAHEPGGPNFLRAENATKEASEAATSTRPLLL